jgi:hypothetical protein
MRQRKLRVAWSVGWGIACVLLIVFWVRSRWVVEVLAIPIASNWAVAIGSISDSVALSVSDSPSWKTTSIPANEWEIMVKFGGLKFPSPIWGGRLRTTSLTVLLIPCWMPIALSTTLATVPWLTRIKWRFSLRTLLIATTLIADAGNNRVDDASGLSE